MSKNAKGPRTERGMERYLQMLLTGRRRTLSVETFEDRGVLTTNRGLVVAMENGTEFQITIVESTPRS